MEELTPAELTSTLARAAKLLADPARLATVRQTAMARDFSWKASAREYAKLYEQLTG
jgi:glycogen synthase